MTIRMRRFKYHPNSIKIIEWYFKNVFGPKLTKEEIDKLSNYNLTQLLLNISFLDYDLSIIESHLKIMKECSLKRITSQSDDIPTKSLVQMISSIYRMKLVFLKNFEDLELLRAVIEKRLDNMNMLDLQSILKGYADVYSTYSYNPKIVAPLVKHIKKNRNRVNSLILTNIMKSLASLRIDHPALYNHIVNLIKADYRRLDNVALAYSFARMVKLNQIKPAMELYHFYSKINFFGNLVNPHNTVQMLYSFAQLGIYDEQAWFTLINNTDDSMLQNIRPSIYDQFSSALKEAFKLCKIEAPELYEKVKHCKLAQRLEEVGRNKDNVITKTQTVISKACQSLGFEVKNEIYIDEVSCDIYLPELNLVIEYNGPSHYLNGTDKLIGSSLNKERLLNGKVKILNIGYFEIAKCKDLNLSFLFIGDAPESLSDKVLEYDSIAEFLKEKIDEVILD